MTFVDAGGHERHDVTMLDPGASAFLSGFGPFFRCLEFLIEDIEFNKCCRKFHFGGAGASWSHWVVRLPMCVGGVVGRAQVFLFKGETPLLCGRPIMEALGTSLDFASKSIRFSNGPWHSTTMGTWSLQFDLQEACDLGSLPCGRACTSEIAESLGASVETFSFETWWNFNFQSHRTAFLRRLEAEVPDELFLAPTCAPWSPMQNLAARDPEQKRRLQELREWHHGTHLTFVKKAFENQIRNGGHALSNLPLPCRGRHSPCPLSQASMPGPTNAKMVASVWILITLGNLFASPQ